MARVRLEAFVSIQSGDQVAWPDIPGMSKPLVLPELHGNYAHGYPEALVRLEGHGKGLQDFSQCQEVEAVTRCIVHGTVSNGVRL